MSQRNSGYARRANEDYPTPFWVAAALAHRLRKRALHVWEPAAGNGELARALAALRFNTIATTDDFLKRAALPHDHIDAIITNPPYASDRKSKIACAFVRHALELDPPLVAMLFRVSLDSIKTRVDLFRDCPRFAGKIVLLDRIKWFDGPSQPSDDHAWFIWDREHRGSPRIAYADKSTAAREENAT